MSKGAASGESKNTLYCSFCGKSQHEVRKLIAGPTVFICDECVELCMDIIREESKTALVKSRDGVPTPSEICDVLDDYVIGQFHFGTLAAVVQPLVVVVDGDRQHALGVELPDHIIIQHLADFARGWHVAGLLDQRRLGFLADDVVAQLHTFIADEHGRARDELPHLVLALATEAAVKRAFAIGAAQLRHDVPSSRRPAIADNIRTGMPPA